ncbi:MAG TPA: hypothetical protein VF604_00395 [Pyrinomonadaceae bacterium]
MKPLSANGFFVPIIPKRFLSLEVLSPAAAVVTGLFDWQVGEARTLFLYRIIDKTSGQMANPRRGRVRRAS